MCPSRRLCLVIYFYVVLQCSAESDVLEFEPEKPALIAENIKIVNGCSAREEFLNCTQAPPCQRTCSNLKGICVTGTCTPGCYCRSGYARDDFTNECIPIRQCPGASCPRNEFFNTCETRTECERTCAERNTPCDAEIPCNTGCQCKSGFFRDPVSKSCIRERECNTSSSNPPRCPRNEHFDSCGSGCKETCPGNQICATECKSGCFCDAGLVRINGRCVEAGRCTKNCPVGEKPDCIVPCTESCDPKACEGKTDTTCREQCVCLTGAKRNSEGNCVPKQQCPLNCDNEEKAACSFPCQEDCNPNACDNQEGDCEFKCFCAPDERRIGGVCKPKDECPLICPSDQEEKTIKPCSESCNPDECSKTPSQTEVKMCACKAGLKRHPDGTCVAECPTCPDGEVFTLSTACEEHCDGFACNTQDRTPIARCSCKNGQKRQFTADGSPGQCVDQTACHCLDNNANYGCLNKCHNDCQYTHMECEDLDESAEKENCVSSCYCKNNFRLVNGACQPFDQCQCGENARYRANGNRCRESCGSSSCLATLARGPGCYCRSSFARFDKDCKRRTDFCAPILI